MKRMICMLLCLLTLLSCGSVLADAPVISDVKIGNGAWAPPYNHDVWKNFVTFELDTDSKIYAKIYDENGNVFNVPKVEGEYTHDLSVNAGTVELTWPGVSYSGKHPEAGSSGSYTVVIKVSNENGSTEETFTINDFTFVHGPDDHIYTPKKKYYPANSSEPMLHNNVRSFGPRLCDVDPSITSKWFRFTPIDLSEDGVQVYDLISGDHFIIGKVYVTVQGDLFQVSFKYYDVNRFWDWSQYSFFTIFSDIDHVNAVAADEVYYRFAYDTTYSISQTLGGDTKVLLYLCNKVTHTADRTQLRIFRPTYDPYEELIAEQMKLMDGYTE